MATSLLYAYILANILGIASCVLTTGSVTITSLQGFRDLRGCARSCLYSGHGDLGEQLECGDDGLRTPYLNTCFCRSDLTSDGSSYLTSCINEGCTTNSVDLSQAIRVWNSYCRFGKYATSRAETPSSKAASLPAHTAAFSTTGASGESLTRRLMIAT